MAATPPEGSLQRGTNPQIPRSVQEALDTDDVLQCILGQLSVATGNMKHMLVCHRWAEHARRSQRILRPKKLLRYKRLAAAGDSYEREGRQGPFSDLRVLDIRAYEPTDGFISLCGSSGRLQFLQILYPEDPFSYGLHYPGYSPSIPITFKLPDDDSTDDTYRRLFAENTGLEGLRLSHNVMSVPTEMALLSGLKELWMYYDSHRVFIGILDVALTLPQLEALHLHSHPLSTETDADDALMAEARDLMEHLRLVETSQRTTTPPVPNLQEMSIDVFRYLRRTSPALVPQSMLTLSIHEDEIDAQVQEMPKLQKLRIISSLIDFAPSGPSSLRSLELVDCPVVDDLEGLTALIGLEELAVKNCPMFQGRHQDFRSVLGSLGNLRRLTMDRVTTLYGLELQRDSLRFLELSVCSKLVHVDRIAALTSLEELHISQGRGVRQVPSCWSQLVSLRKLTLDRLPSLQTLSDGLTSVASLQTLRIRDCPSISYVPAGLLDLRLDEDSKKRLLKLMNSIASSK